MDQKVKSHEQLSLAPDSGRSVEAESVSSGGIGDFTFSSTSNSLGDNKYKVYYDSLYKCLCHLESENKKLLNLILQKTSTDQNAVELKDLLDPFAVKVAAKRDEYEKTLFLTAVDQGEQAFLARRWKARFRNLLDILIQLQTGSTGAGSMTENGELLKEFRTVPWDDMKQWTNSMVQDVQIMDDSIEGSASNHESERSPSVYEFDDLTISISSVLLQDLLARHNTYNREIKRLRDGRYHLQNVLQKNKEQRNQLKKIVTEQDSEIQKLEDDIREAETLFFQTKRSRGGRTSKNAEFGLNELSDNNEMQEQQRLMLAQSKELEKLKAEIRHLDHRKRELNGMLLEEEIQRRALSKRFRDLVGGIHVSCRIKPHPENYFMVVSEDKLLCPRQSPELENVNSSLDIDQMRCFVFEKILIPGMDLQGLGQDITEHVNETLEGKNICVMTYGLRDSGKTFTMFGGVQEQLSPASAHVEVGVAQMVVNTLFQLVRQRLSCHYEISISANAMDDNFMSDLLAEMKDFHLRDSEASHWLSTDYSQQCNSKVCTLHSENDFAKIVEELRENSHRKMHRSLHTLLSVYVDAYQKSDKQYLHRSLLLFADLGSWEYPSGVEQSEMNVTLDNPTLISEKCNEIPAAPLSGTGVNGSLLALAGIFNALRKQKQPNYSASLLTKMLQPVITGESRCFLILTINPDPSEFDSTLSCLEVAQHAMQAITKLPHSNK